MSSEYVVGLTYADRLRLVSESRLAAINTWLDSEAVSLTSLMGPLSDGPQWPASPAWLAAKSADLAYIISDGLSDPWVERDKSETGLGLEVFIASPDSGLKPDAAIASIADTWLFPCVAEISHTIAGLPSLAKRLVEGEYCSLEFNIEHIKDGRGRVGVLLNLIQHQLPVSAGEITLVAATLLTVSELRYLRGKGVAGRNYLADQLISAGVGHLSLLQRPSVL